MFLPFFVLLLLIFAFFVSIYTNSISSFANSINIGSTAAVELSLTLCAVLCFWSGLMRIAAASGIMAALSRIFRPFLRFMFPLASQDTEILETISANISANLLGISNAATPMGLKAASLIHTKLGMRGKNELIALIIINTASIQLFPTTVAMLRFKAGSASPYDILPAVWAASGLAFVVAVAASKLLQKP